MICFWRGRNRFPRSATSAAPDSENLRDLREEAIARLKGYQNRPQQKQVPRYLLQMRPDQNFAVVVDTQKIPSVPVSQRWRPPNLRGGLLHHAGKGWRRKTTRRRQENSDRRLSRHGSIVQGKSWRFLWSKGLPDQLPERMGQAEKGVTVTGSGCTVFQLTPTPARLRPQMAVWF